MEAGKESHKAWQRERDKETETQIHREKNRDERHSEKTQTEGVKQETGPPRQKGSQSDNSPMGRESGRGQCQLQDGTSSPSLSDPHSDIHTPTLSSTA